MTCPKPSLSLYQRPQAGPALAEQRAAVQAGLGQVGVHLGRFGAGIVSGTTDLFEQVRWGQGA